MRLRSRALINALTFMIVGLIAFSGIGVAQAQVPPCPDGGGNSGAATALGATPCEGTMAGGENAEWFSIPLARGQRAVVSSTTTSGPTPFSYGFQMLRPGGAAVGGCLDNNAVSDACTFVASETGNHLLGVIRIGAQASGTYVLEVATAPAPNDCAEGEDIGETIAQAHPVTALNDLVVLCDGELGPEDAGDVYAITDVVLGVTLGAATVIPTGVLPVGGVGPRVEILDPAGNTVTQTGLLSSVQIEANSSGTWYARVAGRPGPYQISITAVDDDCPEGAGDGDGDASNTFANARSLDPPAEPHHVEYTNGCPHGAQIHPSGDPQDWWLLPMRRNVLASLSLQAPPGTAMYLYDGGQTLRATGSPTSPITFRSLSAHNNADDWRVLVEKAAGAPASYRLSATVSDRDCQTSGDVNGSTADPLVLPNDVTDPDLQDVCGATLWQFNDVDVYRVGGVGVTGLLDVRLTWPDQAKDFDLALVRPDNTVISVPEGAGLEQIVWEAEAAGDWHIRISSSSGHAGRYDLAVGHVASNDCGLNKDAGDVQASADAIASFPPVQCEGTLPHTADTDDWYSFPVDTAVAQVTVAMEPLGTQGVGLNSPPLPNADYDLEVVDGLGNVHRSETAGPGVPERLVLLKPVGAGGDGNWFVRVKYRTGAHGRYTLAISQATV